MSTYFCILTSLGAAKMANATALGEVVEFSQMALGDGGGSLPTPDQSQISLVNEVRRAALNSVEIDPDNPTWIVCEQVIPAETGGWTIRETGIYDTDGDLIAVGNFPETYKPVLEEGSGRTQTIRMVIQVSNAATVTLKIDPSVVLATREYVDQSSDEHLADAKLYSEDAGNLKKGQVSNDRLNTTSSEVDGDSDSLMVRGFMGLGNLDGSLEAASRIDDFSSISFESFLNGHIMRTPSSPANMPNGVSGGVATAFVKKRNDSDGTISVDFHGGRDSFFLYFNQGSSSWARVFTSLNAASSAEIKLGLEGSRGVTPEGLKGAGFFPTFDPSSRYENLTGDIVEGFEYTNVTDVPKFVIVEVFDNGVTNSGSITVDGELLKIPNMSSSGYYLFSFVVLPGMTYGEIDLNGMTLTKWLEL